MSRDSDAYDAHQRQRWLRHDAHLWIRNDAARWVKPGTDPADVYPTLARKPDAAKTAAFEAEVAAGYRLLAVLREEVASLWAELKRRRLEEAKYSPDQPRVPAGNPHGGQWTDRGGSGSSYDATPSTNARSDGDGTRGTDDRLAASDKQKPGRAATLEIMARAAERAIRAYRSGNLLFDLFGNKSGAIAVTTMDDKDIYGSNSTSHSYKDADFKAATELREKLVAKYPDAMRADNVGFAPANALFHAETNVLLRAAEANGGTLAGRSLDIYVDREMCRNCESMIPLVGLELGNPTLTYVDPYSIHSIANGTITSRSRR